ncbi:MAG: restriction endonuclease subunit S [Bacteroidia bacterium]
MIIKNLEDLCFPEDCGKYGIPASAEPFSKEKYRYLRISDITDHGILINDDKKSVSGENIDKYLLGDGDIVFARTGNSTGRSYLYQKEDGELIFAGFLIKYKLDPEKVNPEYVRYFTVSKYYQKWIENLSVGSTRGNINAETFKKCPIFLPERNQQDFLAHILSTLDKKIELNNRINRELEAMAKLIYDYWFVQFDFPFDFAQGKPSAEGKPYKSSGGRMVYSEALKREIPEGWEVKSLSDLISTEKGGDWGKEEMQGSYICEVHCIRGADINGLNGRGALKSPTRFILEKNRHKELESHDLIVEISGGSPTQSTGRLAYITDETLNRFTTPIMCSNFCKAITLKNKRVSFNFAHHWARLYDSRSTF